jgi:hypothetical protein
MISKKIKFIPFDIFTEQTEDGPVPSYTKIPEWFKNIPAEQSFSNQDYYSGNASPWSKFKNTIKMCVPVLDSFTSGYMVCLPQDVEIQNIDGRVVPIWGVSRMLNDLIDRDLEFRTNGFKMPDSYDKQTARIHTNFTIKTPNGYSLLITHPLNRFDLPFATLSAVIDSDKFSRDLIITMFIKNDFTGIIPKGTPIAQLFPFKRDNWESKKEKPMSEIEKYKKRFDLGSIGNRAYKKLYWSKKTYR